MTVSYKRNRDYSKQFNWTYELKENLYGCYKKAKEIGIYEAHERILG